ncbi:MAG: hypothetical protein QOH79_1861 [Acidimicrobiaceae bacterium]|jgi:hypothetical protein
MYRLVLREEVIYGHFREYLEIANEMVAYGKSKGWADAVLMAPTVGTMNVAVTYLDYPNLAAFEKEGQELQSDAEFMKLVRRQAEHIVQGSSRSELMETITEVA